MNAALGHTRRLGLLLLIAAAPGGCGRVTHATLRVATLNLAHGRGPVMSSLGHLGRSRRTFEENLTAISQALKREAPDVIALQEADAPSEWSGRFDHVAFLADAAGYPHRHHGLHVDLERAGTALRYGTALLARRELADAGSHAFRAEPTDTKGYVLAEIEFAGRPVVVVSVHFDFKWAGIRRKQARALIERLSRREAPLIVLGDFNATWNRPDDALRLMAAALNLHAYRPNCTGRSTHPAHHPRRRIDWILISSELQFRGQWRWPDQLSDHLGLTAEVAWR